jgi:hypothetical protein
MHDFITVTPKIKYPQPVKTNPHTIQLTDKGRVKKYLAITKSCFQNLFSLPARV